LANVHRKFARAVDNELDQEDDRDHREERRRRRDRDEADHYGGPEDDESWDFGKRSPQTTWIVLAVVAGIVLFLSYGILTVVFTTIGLLGRNVQIQPVGPPPHPGPADPGRGHPVVPGPMAAFPDQAFLDDLVETESTVG
jgi:hypothetical protein